MRAGTGAVKGGGDGACAPRFVSATVMLTRVVVCSQGGDCSQISVDQRRSPLSTSNPSSPVAGAGGAGVPEQGWCRCIYLGLGWVLEEGACSSCRVLKGAA